MENNTCCAIFSPSSFGSKKNGRGSGRRVSQYSRFDNRIFSIFRFFVWLAVWFCPCFFRTSLAENDYTGMINGILNDTGQILGEVGTIDGRLEREIIPDLEENRQYLYYIKSNTDFLKNGFGYFGGSAGVFKDDVNTIILKLSNINDNITVLQDGVTELGLVNQKLDSILEYLNGTGGSGGTLPTDIATETTLSAFKSKYEDISNQFLTSWGFVGGSGGTLKDYLVSVFGDSPSNTITYYLYDVFENPSETSPFPNSDKYWYDLTRYETSMTVNSPFEAIINQLFYDQYNKEYYFRANLMNMQKQSWNDWYAHTNSIARLDLIVSSLNSTPDIYVNDTDDIGTVTDDKLNITFDKSTGDAAESIELNPAFTNDVAELTAPAQSLTNKVAKLITYSKLSNRYKTPDLDNTNYRDYEVTQDIPDYKLQYGTRPQMHFQFTSVSRNLFRGFLPREKMATLRSIFLKLWAFLAIYCNFLIFKIFGKMGGNE